MMFRRTEDEEESGSDWDEMTPRTTNVSTPPALLSLPITATTTITTTATPTSPDHTPSHYTPSAIIRPPSGERCGSGSPLQQPALEAPPNSDRSIPSLLIQDTSNHRTHTRPVRKQGVATMGSGFPNKGVRWESGVGGGVELDKLEDELTSIATVKTPQPPPLRPVPPTVYRAATEFQDKEEGQEEELGGGARRGQRSPSRGLAGENLPQLDDEFKADLEFSTVSGQRADYLFPHHQPPTAYMTKIASRFEGHSERCIEEVCSTVRIASDFVIAVLLGSVHCILNHVVRKLCCGLGHILSDTLCKPLVPLCFNGLLWPLLAGMVQVSRGVVLVVGPLLEVVGVLMGWVVQIARACRLVLINNRAYHTSTQQKHQV